MPNSTAAVKQDASGSGTDRETIAGLARGLAVIRAFSEVGPRCTLTDLANATRLPPAAVRRCLHTLENLGYAGRLGRQFFLRPRILELSAAYLVSVNTEELVSDYLQEVAAETHQASSLSRLDRAEIVYLAHTGPRRLLRVEASVGVRYPAFATSMGRVLLGAMTDDEVRALLHEHPPAKLTRKTVVDVEDLVVLVAKARQAGCAIVEDQLAIGVLSIAVPVRDRHGRVVAAINCSAQAGEFSQAAMKRFLPVLERTSQRITQAISHFPALTLP